MQVLLAHGHRHQGRLALQLALAPEHCNLQIIALLLKAHGELGQSWQTVLNEAECQEVLRTLDALIQTERRVLTTRHNATGAGADDINFMTMTQMSLGTVAQATLGEFVEHLHKTGTPRVMDAVEDMTQVWSKLRGLGTTLSAFGTETIQGIGSTLQFSPGASNQSSSSSSSSGDGLPRPLVFNSRISTRSATTSNPFGHLVRK